MLLSVLTKNLNWESLTKNLVTYIFNIIGVHWKICIFRGEGVHELKWGGGGLGLDSFQILVGRGPGKKRGCFLPQFGRQGACHDIMKSADSQTNKQISDNDCMTVGFYKNVYQTNNFKLRIFEKTQIGWR